MKFKKNKWDSVKSPSKINSTDNGFELNNILITSPIQLICLFKNEDSANWAKLFVVKDPDGKSHHVEIYNEELIADALSVLKKLAKNGFKVYNSSLKNIIINFLNNWDSKYRKIKVFKTGWHNNTFISPTRIFGDINGDYLFEDSSKSSYQLLTSGTLDQWKKNVANYAIGNSKVITAMCLSISAPFISIANQPNFGIHFFGSSSCGKTITAKVAASIWSKNFGQDSFIKSWRSTGNAIEGTANSHNHLILILDEIAEIKSEELGKTIYMLGSGQGKDRANQFGDNTERKKFELVFMSTGEISLEEIMIQTKERICAGQEVRFIEIDSNSNGEFGIFDNIHQFENSKEMANYLNTSSSEYYGTAGEKLLSLLVSKVKNSQKQLKDEICELKTKFKKTFKFNKNPQVERVADSFSFLAACGELAIKYEIFPFNEGDCFEGVRNSFWIWYNYKDRTDLSDDVRIIQNIRNYFEKYGNTKFINFTNLHENEILPLELDLKTQSWSQAGYRGNYNGYPCWFLYPGVFKDEVCRGFNFNRVKKILKDKGYLIPSQSENFITKRFGKETKRVYVISESILG